MVNCQEGHLSIYEFIQGMESAQPLWTGIPCVELLSIYTRPLFSVSPDGHYLLIKTEAESPAGIVDLTTGEYKLLPRTTLTTGTSGIGLFSPNGQTIAFFLEGNPTSSVLLFDMATEMYTKIFEIHAPCATYIPENEFRFKNICAEVGLARWVNDTTMVYSAYMAAMPEEIKDGRSPLPDRTFVASVDGTILHEFTPALNIFGIYGTTLVYEFYSTPFVRLWLDTTDLVNGSVNANSFDKARAAVYSPDGRYALLVTKGVRHLVELQTGKDKRLVRTEVEFCVNEPVWSPDGKYYLCNSPGYDTPPTVISLEGYRDRVLPPFDGDAIAWLP